jgi:leader peptidase (prepilin peptidase)/N-methyltransferase
MTSFTIPMIHLVTTLTSQISADAATAISQFSIINSQFSSLASASILSSQFADVPRAFWATLAFVVGALVGSFLNVVIHRWPLGESIVFPASRCGSCRAAIKPWDNIPIVSWLLLRGRCRACGASFSSRYMLVELANALFYLAVFARMGISPGAFLVAAIVSMTIVLIFIDLDVQFLPDVVTIPGVAVGIAIGTLHLGRLYPGMLLASVWWESVAGALIGASLIYGVNRLYRAVRGIDGMGMGDAKMLAMIGATMGWIAVLPVLFLASMVGALFGVTMMLRSDDGWQTQIPFGVFLGFALFVVLFFGTTLAEWYLGAVLL